MRWMLVLALLGFAIPAFAGDGNDHNGENRCDDLGAVCTDAESFDTSSYTDVQNGILWNPDNSTSKEALAFYTTSGLSPWDPNPYVVQASQLVSSGIGDLLPVGATPTYVYLMETTTHTLEGHTTGAGIRRICERHYFMRDQDTTQNLPAPCNVKDMEADIGGCEYIIGNCSHGSEMCFISRQAGPCGNGFCDNGQGGTYSKPECVGTGNMNQNSCIGHWCRMEFCWYGGLTGTDPVHTEGYMVRVDNPSIRRDWADANYGDIPGDGTGGGLGDKIISSFAPDSCTTQGKVVSHAMMAAWTTDSPGTFIGAASEIEGGIPAVTCSNNGPVTQGGSFQVTASATGFSDNSTPSYTFDMDADTDIGTCTSANGAGDYTSGTCDSINNACTCIKNATALSPGDHVIACEAHSFSEVATGTTTLHVNAPPAVSEGLSGGAIRGGSLR